MTALAGPRARPDLWVELLDEEAVLRDPATGRFYVLDRIATLLWPWLDGTVSVDELAADCAAAFEAPLERVREDVEVLLADLAARELLERR